MVETYLHGVEVIQVDIGTRPVRTVRSSVIGLVGTAPEASNESFPLNTPVLVNSDKAIGRLGMTGTLGKSLRGIYDQIGAVVVIVRVAEGTEENDTITNIIGGADENGVRTGLHVLLNAKSILGVQPRILVAPHYSQDDAVRAELQTIADRLKAVAPIDGENTTDAEAITKAGTYGSKRLFYVDPYVKAFWDGEVQSEPSSARVAGLIAKQDNERGFWWSPSNQKINGIVGTHRPIDFTQGDANSTANLLNEANVATIINEDGYRLWGNRTLSDDPKYAFLSVVRTADIINDSIQAAHLWAVDRNITKTYVEEVTESVNAYLRSLKAIGAIIDGRCWADPELNTPENIMQGKVYFDFDFTPPYPAEQVKFRSFLTGDYLEDILI